MLDDEELGAADDVELDEDVMLRVEVLELDVVDEVEDAEEEVDTVDDKELEEDVVLRMEALELDAVEDVEEEPEVVDDEEL